MTSSEPTYLPKSPPQNIVILGLGLRHMNLLGDTNIQSITGYIVSERKKPARRVSIQSTCWRKQLFGN